MGAEGRTINPPPALDAEPQHGVAHVAERFSKPPRRLVALLT
jgi:hypothetical protein